jgi:hypothetical protein
LHRKLTQINRYFFNQLVALHFHEWVNTHQFFWVNLSRFSTSVITSSNKLNEFSQ